MPLIYLLFLIPLSTLADGTPPTCTMGSYKYTGVYYSDVYDMEMGSGLQTCNDRKEFDESKMKVEYEANLKLMEELIESILNKPQCVDVRVHLEEYKRRLKKHTAKYKESVDLAIGFLKEYVKEIDIQREFAYISTYNATCNGEHDRKTSFIDLDTINKIAMKPKLTKITESGQRAENCSHVEAHGSEDLNGFEVSLLNAKGSDFVLSFDPYSVPDRLVMKSGSSVLFDSTCAATLPENMNVIIPLSKLSSDKTVSISIDKNCSKTPGGQSSWEFQLKCQAKVEDLCQKERMELISLIKIKVEQTKIIMDAISNQRQCFSFMDEHVLAELEERGLIKSGDVPASNGICETLDEDCEALKQKSMESERVVVPQLSSQKAILIEKRTCPSKPSMEKSILDHIGHAYCTIGYRLLGLE